MQAPPRPPKRQAIPKEPKVSACYKADWKKNTGFRDAQGNGRYWFDCGEFFFDGVYNVVRFPQGMSLYHGSPSLVWYDIIAPLGLDYFNPELNLLTEQEKAFLRDPNVSQDEKRRFLINKNPASAGWYGDYSVAQNYSAAGTVTTDGEPFVCGGNCITAYKLRKDAIFLDLSDPYNLDSLIRESSARNPRISDLLVRTQIGVNARVHNLRNDVASGRNSDPSQDMQYAYHPIKGWTLEHGRRSSLRQANVSNSYELTKQILDYIKSLNYAGYVNPLTPYVNQQNQLTGNTRFAEMVFGPNVLEYVKRDYENDLDWQAEKLKGIPPEIVAFIKDFQRYETSNVDVHSGDLYDHSIWIMFYVNDFLKTKWGQEIPVTGAMRTLILLAAFLHDIGKAGDNVTLYYDKPDHPEVGVQYILGERPYLGKNVNLERILTILGIGPVQRQFIAYLIGMHWKFGDVLRKKQQPEEYLELSRRLLDKLPQLKQSAIADQNVYINLIRTAILISVSDIRALQPYINRRAMLDLSQQIRAGDANARANLNWSLPELPFFTNTSKKHKGKDLFALAQIDTIGFDLRQRIIEAAAKQWPKI